MKKLIFLPILTAVLAGCVAMAPREEMTPLQIQALQSRQYEQPKDIVFASVISVFQDLGYTIKSADKDTGFITAESAAQSTSGFGDITFLANFENTYVTSTVATAFVEQLNAKTAQLRLNFVKQIRISGVQGQTSRRDEPLLEATTYQNAFERIENAIFIRAE